MFRAFFAIFGKFLIFAPKLQKKNAYEELIDPPQHPKIPPRNAET